MHCQCLKTELMRNGVKNLLTNDDGEKKTIHFDRNENNYIRLSRGQSGWVNQDSVSLNANFNENNSAVKKRLKRFSNRLYAIDAYIPNV